MRRRLTASAVVLLATICALLLPVVKAPGSDTWYVAYHRFAVPAGNGTNREVTVDRMTFNADATINPIVPTL